MIVRTWHGLVPTKYAAAFLKHLQMTGVAHSKSITGNLGAFIHHETQGGFEHFFLATYWDNIESIKQFAGENYHIAVTYPDDRQFELISDPYVFQHQVNSLTTL